MSENALNQVTAPTGAETVVWKLSDLFSSPEAVRASLEDCSEKAAAFRARYHGAVGGLNDIALAEALQEFEALHDALNRAASYAYLDWSTHTNDSKKGALFQLVRERYSRIAQDVLFFELELISVSGERVSTWLRSPYLRRYRHYLELLAARREHVLSEAEERILTEKAVTGAGAWARYFDELVGSIEYEVGGERLTEQQVLSRLYEADRARRREAALAFTQGLEGEVRSLSYIFNTLLAEKASDDRLRCYRHWLAARNLANEISDTAVENLVTSVVRRFDLVSRYYDLKRRLLGLEELYDYDRYAPIGREDRAYSWEEARSLVLEAYAAFSPRMAQIAEQFFSGEWVDAAVRFGKQSGAFAHSTVPQVHPYVMLNFTGKVRDVQTLAHELGHGVHQYLARVQGSLQADTPLTMAETASVFGEMLVFERLLQDRKHPRQRLGMLMAKIDDTIATVFRQVAMHRFEDRIHQARREEGELPVDRFNDHWVATQKEMFGGSLTLGSHYRIWWSYIPHFVHSPGYVYAYAFGELLVLALYDLYRRHPEGFADRYLALLQAGGSDWPHELLKPLGVDLLDPGLWQGGLLQIERLIAQAEDLAATPSVIGT